MMVKRPMRPMGSDMARGRPGLRPKRRGQGHKGKRKRKRQAESEHRFDDRIMRGRTSIHRRRPQAQARPRASPRQRARAIISVGAIRPRARPAIMLATFCGDVAPIKMWRPSGGGPPAADRD